MTAALALVTEAFGGVGGIAQYNRDFLSTLAALQRGDKPLTSITVLPRHALGGYDLPAGLEQLPKRSGRIAYSFTAVWLALTRRFDWVLCGHLYMAPLAALVARLCGAKLSVQMHGVEAWKRPTPSRRAAVEAADLVLCVSRYTRARVLSWAAIAPERVVVLPNTVGDAFTPGDSSTLRGKWNLKGKRVLLTVGRMDARERYKGQDRVISVLPQLVAAGHDVAHVVIGDGDDVPRLKSLAVETGVGDRVRFMGTAGLETLADAYRMADVFVMPSTGEGFGIAFLEAMACGTPVVGLATAGALDALADGELGGAADESDLVSALMRALQKPKPNGLALATAARERFGREQFARAASGVVRRLLNVG
jgi:phosphatidyl-myo-inositol dimannoside synthase